MSAYVDVDGAEAKALASLVGSSIDAEYLETAPTLEEALLLCAECGPDGAANARLYGLYGL